MKYVLILASLISMQAMATDFSDPRTKCEGEALAKAQAAIHSIGGGRIYQVGTFLSPEGDNTPDKGSVIILVAKGRDRISIYADVSFAETAGKIDTNNCSVDKVEDPTVEDND